MHETRQYHVDTKNDVIGVDMEVRNKFHENNRNNN